MLLDAIRSASMRGDVGVEPFHIGLEWLIGDFIASVTLARTAQFDSDSDFVIRYQMLSAYSAAGTLIADPDYLISMADSGSGRNFQNIAQHVRNVLGTAQRPFIYAEPKLMKGGGTLTVILQNLTATAARVEVTIHGFKIYYYRGFTREKLGIYQ